MTTPTPHHSSFTFRMLLLAPTQHRQRTEGQFSVRVPHGVSTVRFWVRVSFRPCAATWYETQVCVRSCICDRDVTLSTATCSRRSRTASGQPMNPTRKYDDAIYILLTHFHNNDDAALISNHAARIIHSRLQQH